MKRDRGNDKEERESDEQVEKEDLDDFAERQIWVPLIYTKSSSNEAVFSRDSLRMPFLHARYQYVR